MSAKIQNTNTAAIEIDASFVQRKSDKKMKFISWYYKYTESAILNYFKMPSTPYDLVRDDQDLRIPLHADQAFFHGITFQAKVSSPTLHSHIHLKWLIAFNFALKWKSCRIVAVECVGKLVHTETSIVNVRRPCNKHTHFVGMNLDIKKRTDGQSYLVASIFISVIIDTVDYMYSNLLESLRWWDVGVLYYSIDPTMITKKESRLHTRFIRDSQEILESYRHQFP